MAKEKAKKTFVGLWVDHKKTVIVTISDKGEEMVLTISGVEKHLSRMGDSPLKGSYEAQKVPADDTRKRAFTQHLNVYYDSVIASISNAESILIFGPGLAKNELRKRLVKKNLSGRIVGFEAVDKMTTPQIMARVRLLYS